MKIQDDNTEVCKNITDDGEELVWLPIDEIRNSEIKPAFVKKYIDEIINGNKTIHIICEKEPSYT